MKRFLSGRRQRGQVKVVDNIDDELTRAVGADDSEVVEGARRRSDDRRSAVTGRRGGVDGFATSTSTRLFFALIVGAVVAGPAALLMELGRPEVTPALTTAPSAPAAVGPAFRAASAATQLVRVWLSAGSQDQERVAALVMMPPQTLRLPALRPKPPTWIEVAAVDEAPAGEWRVLVQAGGGLAGQTATYLVLVRVSDTSAAAVSMPARVPAPAPPHSTFANLKTVRLSDPAAAAVSGFITSLLTGDVELDRWLSPDSTLQPGPKACQAVAVTQLLSNTAPTPTDGSEQTVLATVDCTIVKASATRQLVAQPLQYPLVLRARDGRWEVVRYGVSPAGNADSTTAASQPAAATTRTPAPKPSPTER